MNTEKRDANIVNVSSGDYAKIAEDYSLYKAQYAQPVLDAILRTVEKPASDIEVADVGAGTGLWTSMLEAAGVRRIVAIEPSMAMRNIGQTRCNANNVEWINATGENTGLADCSIDLVTMASSLHWVDFDLGCLEVNRILRPGGHFAALWNPRKTNSDPIVNAVDAELAKLSSQFISSSPSRGVNFSSLAKRLKSTGYFSKVAYVECSRAEKLSPAHYLGQLRSATQWHTDLGTVAFNDFLRSIRDMVFSAESITVTRTTIAWICQKLI